MSKSNIITKVGRGREESRGEERSENKDDETRRMIAAGIVL